MKETGNLALLTGFEHYLKSHDSKGWKCYKANDLIVSDFETEEINILTKGKNYNLFFLKVKRTL